MSFQRTRLSADRTLMSVIRTSLSLITFGFTIHALFRQLRESNVLATNALPVRNFAIALVLLGIVMLVVGIIYHLQFMVGLRKERSVMATEGLIHAQSSFPPSMTLVTALLLLLLGIAVSVSQLFHIGPFF